MSQSVVIGIDGGGTKTAISCLELSTKTVLARATKPSTNWNSVGIAVAKQNLQDGIEEVLILSKTSKDQVESICLGMSGVDRESDKVLVENWIKEILPSTKRILIHNDAIAALASGTRGYLLGVVVISGTGMITYGFNKNGEQRRSGGWGPLLGDEGSGHAISIDLLRAVMNAVDESGPPTILVEAVLNKLNLNKPEELIGWAYNEKDTTWQRIASLSSLVYECANKGDQVSIAIIQHAADCLLKAITPVVTKLGFDKEPEFNLVLAGGNLTHNNSLLAQELIKRITNKFSNAKILFPTLEIADASAYLAIESFKQ